MERKALNSLNEAALQVQLDYTTQEPETNEVEMPDMVFEYFNNYFGDNLNEDTDDEDIIKAVEDLVDLCEAVCDAVGIDEAFTRHASSDTSRKVDVVPGKSKVDVNRNFNRKVFGDKEYIKPSPEQLKKAIQKRKENMKDPVLIVKGRDKWGGHVQQKKITGQDMENAAGEKRKAKIARRK